MLVVYRNCFRYDKTKEGENMNFGEKLQYLRKERGLSQEELAGMLHVSRQAVSKWESQGSYPEMEKLILISDLFQVSLDYLIKDQTTPQSYEKNYDYVSEHQIETYMQFKKKFALYMACLIAFIVLGLIIPILCTDTAYETLSGFGFLLVVGIGVFGLIMTGLSTKQYQDIENKEMKMSYSLLQQLQNQYQHFHSRFVVAMASGVLIIILSLAIVALLSELHIPYPQLITAQFILCVSLAVFLFIYYGILDDMYKFLLDNSSYIKEKEKEKENESIYAITMPLAAMIYLIMGFTQNWWHPGWVIFPITVFISMAIAQWRQKQ